MTVAKDQGSRQQDQPERYTRRLDPPPGSPTTRQALNDALLLERYAVTVHEWTGPHIDATPAITTADPAPLPVALRLVVDNTQPGLFDLGEVA